MCGVVGVICQNMQLMEAPSAWLTPMAQALESRGPDDLGTWVDLEQGVALAHRRLSVIDLSSAARQPMVSACGRYVLIYNGEIYNHQDLRLELDNERTCIEWYSHSDTETLLTALAHWGVERTLQNLNGMFAFALWDTRKQTLFLARDRLGEKPLYYGQQGDSFLFASELKALRAYPGWSGKVDRDALALYLRFSYVPAPWSIYQGVRKLPPAHYVTIENNGQSISEPVCYWNLGEIASKGASESLMSNSDELTDQLNELLSASVKQRMIADVPLGTFLSGGYDSSTIAALMQAQSDRPVKTFSIGFHEEEYNEANHAKAVAKHLGTEHTEFYVTPSQVMDVIPKLASIYDEPFSDSSQIPTFLVSQLARNHVTVCLSGDGGDELFSGYNRHIVGPGIWKNVSRLPVPVRRWLGKSIDFAARKNLLAKLQGLTGSARIPHLQQKLEKLGSAFNAGSEGAFYKSLVSNWKHPDQVVLDATEPKTLADFPEKLPNLPGFRERMLYMDMMTYLPDDILTKIDRASMAVSLEARVPLLDHRLVEFSWQVPTSLKYCGGQGKWLLRQVLYRYVPKNLVDRPKKGFGVPIQEWLRGPLREWAENLLNEDRLRKEGFFNPDPIRKMWQEHLSGKRNWHHHLWDILMFQTWWQEQSKN